MSPWNRVIVYLSLCTVSNHITRTRRPAWIAHRNFTPISTLSDDCLLRDDVRGLPWPGHEVDLAAMTAGDGPALWTADVARAADAAEPVDEAQATATATATAGGA